MDSFVKALNTFNEGLIILNCALPFTNLFVL